MRDTGWFTSSYSGGADDNCVEVRVTDAGVGVRDSKNAHGGTLHITPAAWTSFLDTTTNCTGSA